MGGGSGGHITPLLAVAKEIKQNQSDAELYYVIEKGSAFANLVEESNLFKQIISVRAGKFRRYANQSLIAKIIDIKTIILNIRDVFYVIKGYIEANKILKKSRPDIVFIKGGFVAVPVGLACKKLNIPYITHDSDTVPGLANKLIADKARLNCTGMPERFYSYQQSKVRYTGNPIDSHFELVTKAEQNKYKSELGFKKDSPIIMVTGGSQGAQAINMALESIAPDLLHEYKNLVILHQTGQQNGPITTLSEELTSRYIFKEYFSPMYQYTGAADVVITRAGANTIAELAQQGKSSIIIPSPYLTGGHQLTNAKFLKNAKAAIVLDENILSKNPEFLLEAVQNLISEKQIAALVSKNIQAFAKPNAASEIAKIILQEARK